jgi:hypothetical protein
VFYDTFKSYPPQAESPQQPSEPVLFVDPERSDANSWAVFCGHCDAFHWHGAGEGSRAAHCPPGKGYHATGYYLMWPPAVSLATLRKALDKLESAAMEYWCAYTLEDTVAAVDSLRHMLRGWIR